MRPDQFALLTDNGLTEEARILGLYLSEVAREEAQGILLDELAVHLHGCPNPDTVGRHLRMLRLSKYVEKSPGGRGHPDKYLWIARENSRTKDIARDLARAKSAYPSNIHGLNDTVVVGEVRVGEEEENARAREPALDVENLSSNALRVMEDHQDDLEGCQGALRDYLLLRVPRDRQYPYVRTVINWFAGLDPTLWKLPTGASLPSEDRAPLLTQALNDLGASDEKMMKRPVGDIANLRVKVGILLKQRVKAPWDGPKTSAAEEQAQEEAKRRRAGQRAVIQRQDDAEARTAQERTELLAWYGTQGGDIQADLLEDAETRVETLTQAGVPRSERMEEMCLLQAVKAYRHREPMEVVGT